MNKIAFNKYAGLVLVFGLAALVQAATASSGVDVQSFSSSGSTPQGVENTSIRIGNASTSQAIDLRQYKIRYWFSDSEAISNINANVWWYSLGSSGDVSVSFGGDSAQRYAEISFANGVIAASSYAEVQFGINNNDYKSLCNDSNYSKSSSTGFTENLKITVYRHDTLVWGTQPLASSIDTSTTSTTDTSSSSTQTGSTTGSVTDASLYDSLTENIQQYAVWGIQSVNISDRVQVNGKVGSGKFVEIGADGKIYGNVNSSDSVFLRSRAHVTGNIQVPQAPVEQTNIVVDGNVNAVAFPKLAFAGEDSILAVANGTNAYNVGPRTQAVLNPGTYSTITIGAGAIVTINPGVIRATSVYVNPDAVLIIPSGLAATSFVATQSITIGDRVTIEFTNNPNPVSLSFLSAKDIAIGNDWNPHRLLDRSDGIVLRFTGIKTGTGTAMHGQRLHADIFRHFSNTAFASFIPRSRTARSRRKSPEFRPPVTTRMSRIPASTSV